MKKLFMIALAGMMMIAFTQCGGKTENKDGKAEEKTEAVKGSKEFRDSKAALDEITKILEGVKTCEDFEKAGDKIAEIGDKMDKTEYKAEEKMTKEEQKEFEKMAEKFTTLSMEKAKLCY